MHRTVDLGPITNKPIGQPARGDEMFATCCKLRDNTRMERVVTKTVLHPGADNRDADLRFWLAQPLEARIAALEALRQQYISTRPDADTRLQRVCRITQLKPG